jgi:hypothetical protein
MSKKEDEGKKGSAVATQQEESATAESTSLVKVAPAEVAVATMDDMFLENKGEGFAGMGANDFAIPFLAILQKGSPQVSRANAKYIKGAEQGMVINTVTQDLYDGEKGILYIPCGYSKSFVEWKSRDSGGGLVAHHKEGDPFLKTCTRNERSQLVVPDNGNIVVDTAYHFGLFVDESGLPDFAVISMYSTQLKKSRMWNTTMRRIMFSGPQGPYNPPTYSHMYRMTTVGETKDTYDWYGWKIVVEKKLDNVELYKMAREFSRQVELGNVRVSAPPQEFADSEDVPF